MKRLRDLSNDSYFFFLLKLELSSRPNIPDKHHVGGIN